VYCNFFLYPSQGDVGLCEFICGRKIFILYSLTSLVTVVVCVVYATDCFCVLSSSFCSSPTLSLSSSLVRLFVLSLVRVRPCFCFAARSVRHDTVAQPSPEQRPLPLCCNSRVIGVPKACICLGALLRSRAKQPHSRHSVPSSCTIVKVEAARVKVEDDVDEEMRRGE